MSILVSKNPIFPGHLPGHLPPGLAGRSPACEVFRKEARFPGHLCFLSEGLARRSRRPSTPKKGPPPPLLGSARAGEPGGERAHGARRSPERRWGAGSARPCGLYLLGPLARPRRPARTPPSFPAVKRFSLPRGSPDLHAPRQETAENRDLQSIGHALCEAVAPSRPPIGRRPAPPPGPEAPASGLSGPLSRFSGLQAKPTPPQAPRPHTAARAAGPGLRISPPDPYRPWR